MALRQTPVIAFPRIVPWKSGSSPTFVTTTMNINGASEKYACMFIPPKTGNIRKVHWRTGVVSAVGANPYDVRIETVGADGFPTGTLWGTNTNIAHTIGINDDNVWITSAALTADAVVTDLNTLMAVVIANPPTGFSSMQVAALGGMLTGGPGRPYHALFTTAWAFQDLTPVLALEYSDGSFEHLPGMWPVELATALNVTSATTPDEVGIKFRIPFPARLKGFWNISSAVDSSAAFDIVFYNAAGSVALTKTFAAGQWHNAYRYTEEFFSDTFTLEPDTDYRLSFKPATSFTANRSYFGCDSAALMAAMPGGVDVHWTERVDGGAWTEDTTRWPHMGVLLDQVSDDASGPGGIFIPRRFVA